MKPFFLLTLLCLTCSAYSQQFDYKPSKSELKSEREFEKLMEEQLEVDLSSLSSNRRNNQNVGQIYASRSAFIVLMATEEEEYIFNSPANEYVETVFSELLTANPKLAELQPRIFLSRDMAPNASCFGEGSLVLNIGLLRRLENESQLAFVLGHELAHLEANHVNNAIVNHVEVQNSPETQQEIERILKLKYNRNQASLHLLKNLNYDSSRHSRLHESEADEMALSYVSKAGYDVAEAVNVMNILSSVDQEKYQQEIDIWREFNRELYPFQEKWLEDDNPLSIFFEEDTEQKVLNIPADSLKTHPKTEERARLIQQQLTQFSAGEISKQAVSKHDQAVTQADFDYVLSAYHYKKYGYAIYQALQLEQQYPDHPFLVGIIGACMGEMVEAIDDHEQGKLLAHTSPEFTENYNLLLTFLNNLSMEEMANVSFQYVRTYKEQAKENEALAYALAVTADAKGRDDQRNNFKNIYKNNFQDGYFYRKVTRI